MPPQSDEWDPCEVREEKAADQQVSQAASQERIKGLLPGRSRIRAALQLQLPVMLRPSASQPWLSGKGVRSVQKGGAAVVKRRPPLLSFFWARGAERAIGDRTGQARWANGWGREEKPEPTRKPDAEA